MGTIGQRIRSKRCEQGLSQTELAERAHVSKQTLYKYENDIITNIPSDKLEYIAYALDVSPAYLMGWESDISEPFASTSPSLVAKLMTDEQAKRLLEMFLELSPESRKSVYDLTEYLYHK